MKRFSLVDIINICLRYIKLIIYFFVSVVNLFIFVYYFIFLFMIYCIIYDFNILCMFFEFGMIDIFNCRINIVC